MKVGEFLADLFFVLTVLLRFCRTLRTQPFYHIVDAARSETRGNTYNGNTHILKTISLFAVFAIEMNVLV